MCICVCVQTHILILHILILFLFFFLDNTGFSQETGPSRIGEDIVTHGGRVNDSGKKILPLLNQVLSLSSELEEEDDEPYVSCFILKNDVVKHMYEDEEVDVVVIDSRENNTMDDCDNQACSMSRGMVSLEEKIEKNVNNSNDEKGKDDWEVYADNSSFWEDGQRLTNSWYGYEKVPVDGFDNDDSFDKVISEYACLF